MKVHVSVDSRIRERDVEIASFGSEWTPTPAQPNGGTAEVQFLDNDRKATRLKQLEHQNIDVKLELIDANIGLDLRNGTF